VQQTCSGSIDLLRLSYDLPHSDGDGRLGGIINVLFLTRCGLLDIPILYLSRFISSDFCGTQIRKFIAIDGLSIGS